MQIYDTLGKPKEVRTAYERLKNALERELARRPSPETEAVVKKLTG